MMIPCLEGRPDDAPAGMQRVVLGLAAARGVELHAGVALARPRSAWTTLHLVGDGEKQAAEILGIPFDKYSQGGLFPIAYTKGTDFRGQAAARRAVRALERLVMLFRLRSGEPVLPPRLVDGDRGGVGQVQRPPAGQHRECAPAR